MFKRNIEIPYYMVKENGDMSLSYLIRELAATSSMDPLGTDLGNENLAWVLVSWDIDLKSMPKFDENIELSTKALGHKSFYALRNFEIRKSNQLIGQVKSLWTIIDLSKRTLASLPDSIKEDFSQVDRKILKKYQVKESELERPYKTIDLQIYNTNIDSNGHVSNAVYLDWMENSLGWEAYQSFSYERVKILYRKEIKRGEDLKARIKIQDKDIYFQVYNSKTEELKTHINARIK